MLSVNLRFLGVSQRLHNSAISCLKNIRYCSDGSDDEKVTKKLDRDNKETKKDVAKKKLNQLLEMMIKEDVVNAKTKLDLARPERRRSEPKLEKGTKSVTTEKVDQKLISAVKDVAVSVGGNEKQTESELLSKLLNSTTSDQASETLASLSDIVKGMKIDRTEKPESISRAQQVRQLLGTVGQKPQLHRSTSAPRQRKRDVGNIQPMKNAPIVPIDLFGAEPLGIFTREGVPVVPTSETPWQLSMWDTLHERDLRLAVTHPPTNYFQQMIQWTEQGKLWRFPIDNEQGMDEEHAVYFSEHVFLEQYLEPWCPKRGPIRHFMELVCVGMSKNPYMSVTRKREHIDWYRDYFTERRQLIEDVGAGIITVGNETTEEIASIDAGNSKP